MAELKEPPITIPFADNAVQLLLFQDIPPLNEKTRQNDEQQVARGTGEGMNNTRSQCSVPYSLGDNKN